MRKQTADNKPTEPESANTVVEDSGESGENTDNISPHHEPRARKQGKPVTIDHEELELLKAKAADSEKYYDQLLRARAEFDNYRKRLAQERQYADLVANEKLLQKLIGILDTFDLAISSAEKDESAKKVLDGIKLLRSQFQTALQDSGVEEIDALHQRFDPNFHEAIRQIEVKDREEGTVVEQVRKGYKFKERLLRPASVVVSKKPEATPVEQ